jgi:hypothetical protein
MRKVLFLSIAFCCLFGGSGGAYARQTAADTIFVSELGLLPDSRENATPFLLKALEAGKTKASSVICFPKGRYDFWPHRCIERFYPESNTDNFEPKRLAMLIEKQSNLIIEGNGSDLVFHDRIQPFTVDNSTDITIRNFTIDWDIPLTAQALVTQTSDDFIELKINIIESPYIIENNQLVFVGEGWKSAWGGAMEFDGKTRVVVPQTGDQGCIRYKGDYRAVEFVPGTVRIYADYERKPATGNLLVMRHSRRDHAGIFITDSRNVRVESVNLYHCCGLGILSQYSENLIFKDVNCVPNKKKNRILAGHDDGFHYSNCKGDVVVDHCSFHALMDDPINVHGTTIRVMERINDYTLRCKFMHSQSVGMVWARKGDTVAFIEGETMNTVATATVESYIGVGNDDLFDVTFQSPVPKQIEFKDALENLTWTCNVLIKDSYFKSCRARGILVSTPGTVRIENNVFESSGAAILIAGDANFWFESGAVKDVLITKNRFNAPCLTSMYQFCEGIICIYPEIPRIDKNAPAFHRNIRIIDNAFQVFDYPVLYALSVDGITFADNRLVRSYDFEPFHGRKDGLTFKACKHIRVSGNKIEGDVPGKTIRLIDTDPKECKSDKKNFVVLISDSSKP